jgi:hypothetical protein
MYNLYLIAVITIFVLLILSNSTLSKRLRKNTSLQLLLALLIILFSYNDIHVGFLMLAILATVLLSVKREQLSYDKIMNSFGFNSELLSFPSSISSSLSTSLSSISNPLKGLTSKLNLDADEHASEAASEAESEFDDNVSDIDPNDFTMEMDPTVDTDLDNLVNTYLNEDTPSTNKMLTKQTQQTPTEQANDEEHITSEQLAQMFEHLQ